MPQAASPAGTAAVPPAAPAIAKSTAPAGAWDCTGALVPPAGWEHETAFVDAGPGSVQRAFDDARARLVARLCGSAGACEALAAQVRQWKSGEGGGRVCAMAVVEEAELGVWRRSFLSAAALELQLALAAGEVLGKKPRKPRVAIDRIEDGHVAGGPRAEWVRVRLERSFSQAGAVVADLPKGWGGGAIPPGFDLVASAVLTARREQQVPVVELALVVRERGRDGRVAKRVARPVLFSEDVAPRTSAAPAALPPGDPTFTVHLDARAGGSFCRGDRSQLTVFTTETLHVRVFNLYGQDGALLLFPNPEHPDDVVPANRDFPLWKDGFEAQPVEGNEVERFLVVGARAAAGLGHLGPMKGFCRAPAELARKLHRGEGLPAGAKAASDGFRLLGGGACPAAVPPDDLEAQLAKLPECR